MDTINQASQRLFPQKKENPTELEIAMNNNYKVGFQLGLEWASNYIKVADELPPRNERVLIKDKFNGISSFIFTGNCDIKTSCNYMNIIEWRPIEFK